MTSPLLEKLCRPKQKFPLCKLALVTIFFMKDPSDTKSYRAIILKCCLFVKTAKMSDQIFNQLKTSFSERTNFISILKIFCQRNYCPCALTRICDRKFISRQ